MANRNSKKREQRKSRREIFKEIRTDLKNRHKYYLDKKLKLAKNYTGHHTSQSLGAQLPEVYYYILYSLYFVYFNGFCCLLI